MGRRRLADPLTLSRLAKEISHNTGLQQATAEIVLRYMVRAIEDAIKDGRSCDIGIGTISPTISTVAADDAADVKIRKKRILFRASKDLRTIVESMSVKLISDDDDDADDPDNGGTTPSTSSTSSDSSDNGGGGWE